jgi:hypothetical protein
MTVGAEQLKILRTVVPPVAIDVVDLKPERPTVPLRPRAAHGAALFDSGVDQCATQAFARHSSVLRGAEAERAPK